MKFELNIKEHYLSPLCEVIMIEAANVLLIASGDFEKPEDDGQWFWEQ